MSKPELRLMATATDNGRAYGQLIEFNTIEQKILVRGLRMIDAMTRAQLEEKIEFYGSFANEEDWQSDPEFIALKEWANLSKNLLERVKSILR